MKTLIVYATNSGTAQKAAQLINEKLKEKADMVNLNDQKVPDITPYDFIAIGGSIMMGRIQRSLKQFIKKNKKQLMQKKMGLFIACGFPENLNDYFEAILGDIGGHAAFKRSIGYAYYFDRAKPLVKQVMVSIAKVTETVEAFDNEAIQAIADVINGK